MKRFRFQLEPVLDFKQQGLDSLMNELAAIQAQVLAQEQTLEEATTRLSDYDAEYTRKKEEGLTAIEAMECQSCQLVLEQRVRRALEDLMLLRQKEDKKRDQVVAARIETHTLERLREVRKGEHDAAAAKAEEKELDDLTAARRAGADETAGSA